MRMLMKVKVPTEAGNHALKDGILQKVFGEFAKQWNPEALYFIAEDGHRTAVTVFDMKDNSQMVQVAEPFFMAMNAEISWTPCMTQEDLGRGVQAFTKK